MESEEDSLGWQVVSEDDFRVARIYFPSGRIQSEKKERLRDRSGSICEWSSEGVLIMRAMLLDGELNGLFESWWRNGSRKEFGEYINGKRQIGYRWYRIDGSLWSELIG